MASIQSLLATLFKPGFSQVDPRAGMLQPDVPADIGGELGGFSQIEDMLRRTLPPDVPAQISQPLGPDVIDESLRQLLQPKPLRAGELQPDQSQAQQERVRKRLASMFKRAETEAGADTVDLSELDEAGFTPKSFMRKFFIEVFPKLPEESQKKFMRLNKRITGFEGKPGDVIAMQRQPGGGSTPIEATSPVDLVDNDFFTDADSFEELEDRIDNFEGSLKPVKGMIILMGEAFKRMSSEEEQRRITQ